MTCHLTENDLGHLMVSEMASRIENRRSDFSLPVVSRLGFRRATSVRFGLVLFLFPLIEPDWQISRIRLSEPPACRCCDFQIAR